MREPTRLRRLWKTYREKIIGAPLSIHEERLMKEAFHIGAIAMCRVLTHLERRGETERMPKLINRTAVYLENAEKARRRFRN